MKRYNYIFKLLIITNIILLFAFSEYAFCGQGSKNIIIVFRFDDFSIKSNTDFEVHIIDNFKKRNMPITISVIPYKLYDNMQSIVPLDLKKASILKNGIKEGIIEVALHGYTHQNNRIHDNYKSEFRGIDYNTQLKMITEGKHLLDDLLHENITIFVPPWNNYDMNTLRAIEKIGFDFLSADARGEDSDTVSVKYFPETCEIDQVEKAINIARRMKDSQPAIMVVFHSYEFVEENKLRGIISINKLTSLLDFISTQPDLHVLSINGAFNSNQEFSQQRYIYNSNIRALYSYLPKELHIYPISIYYSSEVAGEYWKWSLLTFIVFYIILFVGSITISYLSIVTIIHRLRINIRLFNYIAPLVFIIVTIYALRNHDITYKGAIACIVSLGNCFGVMFAIKNSPIR